MKKYLFAFIALASFITLGITIYTVGQVAMIPLLLMFLSEYLTIKFAAMTFGAFFPEAIDGLVKVKEKLKKELAEMKDEDKEQDA